MIVYDWYDKHFLFMSTYLTTYYSIIVLFLLLFFPIYSQLNYNLVIIVKIKISFFVLVYVLQFLL